MIKIIIIGSIAIKTSINVPNEDKLCGSIVFLIELTTLSHDVELSLIVVGYIDVSYAPNPPGEIHSLIRMIMVIVKIGPIEAIPTRPNESLLASFPERTVAIPKPSERINGTVAEPVVIPPASKIKGKYCPLLIRQMSIKTIK